MLFFSDDVFAPIVSVFFMIALMGIMIVLYIKLRVWIVILTVYAFSLLIGMTALSQGIPLTPYFEVFFMTFQSIMFLITSVEAIKK